MAKFMVILDLPSPRIEHREAKQRIEEWSTSKPMMLFNAGVRIAYLFTTERRLDEMDFGGVLFAEDSYLFIELGDRHVGEGFRLEEQRTWLNKHHHQ